MKKRMILLSLVIIVFLSTVFQPVPSSRESHVYAEEGIITTDDLNIRSGPGLDYDVIGQASQNTSVQILEKSGDWFKVQFQNFAGWVSGDYVRQSPEQSQSLETLHISVKDTEIAVHTKASITSPTIKKISSGQTYPITDEKKNWYQIQFTNGDRGWVAKWLVDSSTDRQDEDQTNTLKGKVIVVDAGHGGADTGTISASGDYEKLVTTVTARTLASKLETMGARPVLTRTTDTFQPLENRVAHAQAYQADAFISIHYNSSPQFPSVNGIGTYYYHDRQKPLAASIHQEVLKTTGSNNRKVKFGNYMVIRENQRPAVLIELGFLSNQREEAKVNTRSFQEKATNGIIRGLRKYFR
ncbi:SH3 domain-containing protein [Virgibacillus sp. MSP4-1]|uniref:N-acetylmuramoyl-L-alanine amidase n=1 Tax=Virgibacillus sp. MSP4-1 TaxID=2700081 RepID=UPI0003A5E519|nr:N-acetylmuramoyl-L-alanine amidase [Virgibacillus sp. MSP4-1]QHS22871.1 SH3 domain-containing protein [Virgibacillus sp. MSP4-1]